MNYVDVAKGLDQTGDVVAAAWAYEIALSSKPRDLEIRLNLVAIYVWACDTGFAAAHRLDQRFVDVAYDRASDLLADGLRLHPGDAELEGWRLHLQERVIGEPIDPAVLERLASEPAAEFSKLLAYIESGGHAHREEAAALFDRVAMGRTTRERYLLSYAPAPRRGG
jgi:hypothetical protein